MKACKKEIRQVAARETISRVSEQNQSDSKQYPVNAPVIWIWIRIRINFVRLDPDTGGQTLPTEIEKVEKFHVLK
jgi:hypothetical protein